MVLLSACGADSPDAAEVTIESPDGMASLTLSPASLPDGVSVSDIQLEWSAGDSDEAGAPLAGVLLSPSGLGLSQPAILRMNVPTDVEELLAVHIGADGFEFVPADLDSGEAGQTATIEIEHFSAMMVHGPDIFLVTGDAEPLEVVEGDDQFVTMEVEVWNPFVSIWIPIGSYSGSDDGFQRFDFRIESVKPIDNPNPKAVPTVVWVDAANWPFPSALWSPNRVEAAVSRDGLSLAMAASSRCTGPNSDGPEAYVNVQMNLTLLDKGATVSWEMIKFIGDFEDTVYADGSAANRDDKSKLIPFQLEAGDTVQAYQHIRKTWDTECLASAAASTSTSTSTSTTQPTDEGEDDDLKDVGGSGGDSVDDGVKDAAWHYAVPIEDAKAHLESITDCDELNELYFTFSGDTASDDPDIAARALELDDFAYELRQKHGC